MTTAVFEPLSLYDTRPPIRRHDHRNHHDCFTMPIFRLGQPKICAVCLGLKTGRDTAVATGHAHLHIFLKKICKKVNLFQ